MNPRLAALIACFASFALSAQSSTVFSHPDGTIHSYSVVRIPGGIDWAAANEAAAQVGGALATITSQEENDAVFALVNSPEFWDVAPNGEHRGPWLGGVQASRNNEPAGNWGWATLDEFTFDAWTPGQPDDAPMATTGADRFGFGGSATGRTPTWSDAPAKERRPSFVIEYADATIQPSIGLLVDTASTTEDGYFLFNPLRSTQSVLIDNRGRLVKTWDSNYTPGVGIYLREDGNLLRAGALRNPAFQVGGGGGVVEEYDWDSNVVWQFSLSSPTQLLHHDLEPMPNGNTLMIVWVKMTAAEAIAMGRDPSLLIENELWPDKIIEVDRTGSVVWEWFAWDHLVQDFDPTKPNFAPLSSRPERIDVNYNLNGEADWLHTNAVAYNERLDQIMISPRAFNELWVIDHSTTTAEAASSSGGRSGKGGDLLYRWGNPAAYGMGGIEDQELFQAHDTHWVPDNLPGGGNMMAFDNGIGRPDGLFSRGVEFTPPATDANGNYPRPAGGPWGPATPLNTFQTDPTPSFFSQFVSGLQRLASGNTVVTGGWIGSILEFQPNQDIVWFYRSPVDGSLDVMQGAQISPLMFRAPFYESSYPGFAGRDLTPGMPIEGYRLQLLADGSWVDRRARPGQTVDLTIISREDPNELYVLASSLSLGLSPIDNRFLPVVPDTLFVASGSFVNPSVFQGYVGQLDQDGVATGHLVVPNLPGLTGLQLHTVGMVIDPAAPNATKRITNAVTVEIVQ